MHDFKHVSLLCQMTCTTISYRSCMYKDHLYRKYCLSLVCTKIIYIGNIAIVFLYIGPLPQSHNHVWSDTFKGMQISRLKEFMMYHSESLRKWIWVQIYFMYIKVNVLRSVNLDEQHLYPWKPTASSLAFVKWLYMYVKSFNFSRLREYSL